MPSIFEEIGDLFKSPFQRGAEDLAKDLATSAGQAGSSQTASDLFKRVTESQEISDITRKELLFSLGKVDRGQFGSTVPDFLTEGGLPTSPNQLPGRTGGFFNHLNVTDFSHLNLPTTIAGIEERFKQAEGGDTSEDSIFSARKRSEASSKQAKDQPGSRQFLLESPGVSGGPSSALPKLTQR